MLVRLVNMLCVRNLTIFTLSIAACTALCQGAAGGFGQGGAAGYGQGGGGRAGGARFGANQGSYAPAEYNADEEQVDARRARPDEDEGNGAWIAKSAILTPGDRVEYKLQIHQGETLFAGATSDAFDPALAVLDPTGKMVAQNDDRAEGDQSPFIIYRFPADGTYTLKVLGYKSASGGKFTLKFRSFHAFDAPLGMQTFKGKADPASASDRVLLRINGSKGKVYDLRRMQGLGSIIRIVGPTGVEANDFAMIPTPDNSTVFTSKLDGSYYIEVAGNPSAGFSTDFREVAEETLGTSQEQTYKFGSDELRIVNFPVTPKLILRTTITGVGIQAALSAPAGENERSANNFSSGTWGKLRAYSWFLMNRDSVLDQTRVFYGSGTARLVLRSSAAGTTQVKVANSDKPVLWEDRKISTGPLEIGEVKLFLLKSKKSELMRVDARATHFQPVLDIFWRNGQMANSLSDRKTHTAGDDLYFPDEDSFLVRLTCEGFGGSGEYSLKRDSIAAIPYALGTANELKLDGNNFGIYSVNLEAKKCYEFIVDHPDWPLRVDLLDDDGKFLVSQRMVFNGVAVDYFTPSKTGRHRLWLRAGKGTWHFKLQPNVPPKI